MTHQFKPIYEFCLPAVKTCRNFSGAMARGQQKLQSQAKAAEKAAKAKKQQGHNANSQKKAAQQALVFSCSVCKVRLK